MTGTWSDRRQHLALLAVALSGFALRAFPFFGPDGAWSYRVDYDEGVYFSAASFLLEGAWPYRDFVFAHPPGHLVFLALSSAWTKAFLGVAGAFTLSRWIAALVGMLNILLVGRIVYRSTAHPAAALLAAAMYATYPEVVQVERGPFLEPLLNLACLGLVLALLRASEEGSTYRPAFLTLGGLCAGLAVSIKLWALLWWIGAGAALLSFGSRRDTFIFFRVAVVTTLVIVLPFALRAPGAFLTEVGLFHAWRPPDGLVSRLARVEQVIALRHLASPLLALSMLVLVALRRPLGELVASRVVLVAWPLTLAAFFASSAYWSQYNAHLVASEATLAGLALATLLHGRKQLGIGALVVISLGISTWHSVKRSQSTTEHLQLARSHLRDAPDCLFSFEPGWSLAANRLPPRLGAAPLLVDPYASQLLDALKDGRRFPTAEAAFASNPNLPPLLEQCRYVVPGARGLKQLSPLATERLEKTHQLTNTAGLQLWERL